MSEKLKVGLLLDSLNQPRWIADIIGDIQKSAFAEIIVVFHDGSRLPTRHSSWLWRLYERLDKTLFKTDIDPFQETDVQPSLKNGPRVNRFEALQTYALDVALCFGCDWLQEENPIVTRYGIWFYHHGWNVRGDQSVMESSLIALGRDGGPLRKLFQVYSQAYRFSLHKNRVISIIAAAPFVMRALRDVSERGPESLQNVIARKPASGPESRLKIWQVLSWLVRVTGRILQQVWLKLFFRSQWCLAYKFNDADYQLMVPPPDRFWADPFVWQKDGRYFIFYEECLYENEKGVIAAMEIETGGQVKHLGKVLERPYHLSYPCLFDYQGQLYMVPETAEHGQVELYRCRTFPNDWVFEKALLDHVRAADATVTEIKGRWWMFVTIQPPGTYSSDELHLYSAENPLGPWTAHPRNPVKADVRSARPAGQLFQKEGQWIRPAQDGSGNYGSAIVLNRILRLTPDDYAEETTERILPTWHKAVSRNHTLNRKGALTVTDGLIFRSRFFSI